MNINTFSIIQIILGVILVVLILLQVKGTGLGSSLGGSFNFYQTRRGVEKLLFILTMVVGGLFLISSIIRLVI